MSLKSVVGEDIARSSGWGRGQGQRQRRPGMKVDRDGNFHCCGPGGLHVSSPDARSLGVIGTPEVVANFTWSDDDLRRSILLTASTSPYRCARRRPASRCPDSGRFATAAQFLRTTAGRPSRDDGLMGVNALLPRNDLNASGPFVKGLQMIKTILILADETPAFEMALASAVELGRTFGAHLDVPIARGDRRLRELARCDRREAGNRRGLCPSKRSGSDRSARRLG